MVCFAFKFFTHGILSLAKNRVHLPNTTYPLLNNTEPLSFSLIAANMCITINFLCPACLNDSGKEIVIHCQEGNGCGKPVELERPMKPQHFRGWFCATEYCTLSEASRFRDDLEFQTICRGQGIDIGAVKGFDNNGRYYNYIESFSGRRNVPDSSVTGSSNRTQLCDGRSESDFETDEANAHEDMENLANTSCTPNPVCASQKTHEMSEAQRAHQSSPPILQLHAKPRVRFTKDPRDERGATRSPVIAARLSCL